MRKSPPIMCVKTFSKSHNTYVCTNIEGGLKVTYYGAVNRIQFAMLLGARGLRQKSKRIAIWRHNQLGTILVSLKTKLFLVGGGRPRQSHFGQAVLAGLGCGLLQAGEVQYTMQYCFQWLCSSTSLQIQTITIFTMGGLGLGFIALQKPAERFGFKLLCSSRCIFQRLQTQ